MFRAAQSITAGQWLGPYDWLACGNIWFFAVWLSLCNALHLPYLAAGSCWPAARPGLGLGLCPGAAAK